MIKARPATISTLGLKLEAALVANGGEGLLGVTLCGGGTIALLEATGAGAGAGVVGAGAPGVTT